jgi:hypothetical protein
VVGRVRFNLPDKSQMSKMSESCEGVYINDSLDDIDNWRRAFFFKNESGNLRENKSRSSEEISFRMAVVLEEVVDNS